MVILTSILTALPACGEPRAPETRVADELPLGSTVPSGAVPAVAELVPTDTPPAFAGPLGRARFWRGTWDAGERLDSERLIAGEWLIEWDEGDRRLNDERVLVGVANRVSCRIRETRDLRGTGTGGTGGHEVPVARCSRANMYGWLALHWQDGGPVSPLGNRVTWKLVPDLVRPGNPQMVRGSLPFRGDLVEVQPTAAELRELDDLVLGSIWQ